MDFEEFNKETVPQINKELKKLLEEWRSEVGRIDKSLLSVVDKFIKANEGGKRIRGILVVLGYELGRSQVLNVVPANAGIQLKESGSELDPRLRGDDKRRREDDKKKNENDIYRVAAAYEVFHTAILAHDDIIDKSLTRRNQPSLYQALGGGHQGISLAISLADAGFFLAVKIISESTAKLHLGGAKAHLRGDLTVKALRWFSQTMLDTSLGQILEIERGENLTVARYKTAKYTVSGPLILGAILAKLHLGGVKAHLRGDLKNLAEFGENLGIAFQIQDDILDREVEWVGGTDSAKKEAEKYKNKAMKILPQITKDKKMSKLLEQIAEYLVERDK